MDVVGGFRIINEVFLVDIDVEVRVVTFVVKAHSFALVQKFQICLSLLFLHLDILLEGVEALFHGGDSLVSL